MSKNNRKSKRNDLLIWALKQNEVAPLLKRYVERATTIEEEKRLYELFLDDFLSFSQQVFLCDELDRRVRDGVNPWRVYNTPDIPDWF